MQTCDRCKRQFKHLISVSDHPDFHDGDYCEACNPYSSDPPGATPLLGWAPGDTFSFCKDCGTEMLAATDATQCYSCAKEENYFLLKGIK